MIDLYLSTNSRLFTLKASDLVSLLKKLKDFGKFSKKLIENIWGFGYTVDSIKWNQRRFMILLNKCKRNSDFSSIEIDLCYECEKLFNSISK